MIMVSDRETRQYLNRQMKALSEKIDSALHSIKVWHEEIKNREKEIEIWRIHYTSLLNTRLAYESEEQ